ncbi:hypothetical protein IW15_03165 [Chryseobacterium soli]|uniref:Uncharacterized protein n=1 Tax=Chryseobacterium soli TaxID=445961 RepID=A0A086ACN3_9FLAO|nr:hypothetical protein [Chryseobacterium soli]KFF14447.1 hypothetical protein IW15_03165 [Chryseobacterium soli]
MKQILIGLALIFSFHSNAQTIELKNEKLIAYYEFVNNAEKDILENKLLDANALYAKAFKKFKKPHAKDLYNSMVVSLKVKDSDNAYQQYSSLKCLDYKFKDNFQSENFPNNKKYGEIKCKNKLDYSYKKSLDSLFILDQYYRKLSGGNYTKYQNELTKNDSITSTKLLKLIQKKGFPNEYNIGLESKSKVFFHDFYFIIWHQLATNRYSPQRVNFSKEIVKALNDGKIRPDIAGFLLDLNNGTKDYSFFTIYQFIKNNGESDCCYISSFFTPEKRTDKIKKMVDYVNEKRKKIGLPSSEDELNKNIFLLKNKDYIFLSRTTEGLNFVDENEIERYKVNLIKLDDTPH